MKTFMRSTTLLISLAITVLATSNCGFAKTTPASKKSATAGGAPTTLKTNGAQLALISTDDDIIIPKNSVKTDWEVELALVIGKKAQYVEEADAMNYVAGYCLHNDVSEREFQIERGGNWSKGKGCDSFAPLGPFLATTEEIEDENDLKMWLSVNGKTVQNSNTDQLIFKVPALVSYLSQFMTLLPGDVISTGTPPGVGLGFNPPIYLKEGDVVELGIEGLGTQKQTAKNWKA